MEPRNVMYSNSIFIFGSERLCEIKNDAITSLPLELSWKIFSYLDDASLRIAVRVNKIWKQIILSDKKLKRRLNIFELGLKLGSHHLARFHRENRQRVKTTKRSTKYLPVYQNSANSTDKKIYKSKRGGDVLVICAKRFKLM
ncbi:uncharacterized protein LOC133527297 [Cydia pomonella]|uniref:uncharacterized protein LOC133527297 n=1 Tax=Cydia pomonella TaxID=82600 RepID=UPI002ADDAD4F|nr:uncharacterized protein LOC133527297 [Cydia pomonella]